MILYDLVAYGTGKLSAFKFPCQESCSLGPKMFSVVRCFLAGDEDYTQPRSSENLEMKAFEKFENAVFFKIFKIPSDKQLILV